MTMLFVNKGETIEMGSKEKAFVLENEMKK
jgi:hypothetical protein